MFHSWFASTLCRKGALPVSRLARAGVQMGVGVTASVNANPSAARRSMFGVCTPVASPLMRAPMVSTRCWSVMMSNMFRGRWDLAVKVFRHSFHVCGTRGCETHNYEGIRPAPVLRAIDLHWRHDDGSHPGRHLLDGVECALPRGAAAAPGGDRTIPPRSRAGDERPVRGVRPRHRLPHDGRAAAGRAGVRRRPARTAPAGKPVFHAHCWSGGLAQLAVVVALADGGELAAPAGATVDDRRG